MGYTPTLSSTLSQDVTPEMEQQWKDELMSSPPKNLSPLLEAKRLKYAMPDALWDVSPTYERLILWQIEPTDESGRDDETFPGSKILKPQVTKDRENKESHRAVIVSAGARALTQLQTNGMDVGHTVWVMRLQPWRITFKNWHGKELKVMTINASDIVASEELGAEMRDGKTKLVFSEEFRVHCYERDGRPMLEPQEVETPFES